MDGLHLDMCSHLHGSVPVHGLAVPTFLVRNLQPAVIRTDRHSTDRPLVATQHYRAGGRVFGPQIPEPRRFVLAAGHQPAVIRPDRHRTDGALMAT